MCCCSAPVQVFRFLQMFRLLPQMFSRVQKLSSQVVCFGSVTCWMTFDLHHSSRDLVSRRFIEPWRVGQTYNTHFGSISYTFNPEMLLMHHKVFTGRTKVKMHVVQKTHGRCSSTAQSLNVSLVCTENHHHHQIKPTEVDLISST